MSRHTQELMPALAGLRYDEGAPRRFSILRPCAFVLSADPETGRSNGLAVTWLTQCCHRPEMWEVSLHARSHTLELIRRSGEFVLAFATPELRRAFEYFGTISGAEADKFAATELATAPANTAGVISPWLPDAYANLVCQVAEISPSNPPDNNYFRIVGRVVESHCNPAVSQLYYAGKNEYNERQYVTF